MDLTNSERLKNLLKQKNNSTLIFSDVRVDIFQAIIFELIPVNKIRVL